LNIGQILDSARAFETEAHQVLSVHESSPSRVMDLHPTYATLSNLSLKQDELFRQAIKSASLGLYKAAYVMAWAGAVDVIFEALTANFAALKKVRPNWKEKDIHEMAEAYSEYAFIDVLLLLNLATKGQVKTFHGLLHRRNQCAHPTDYAPDINMTLGYITEVLTEVKKFQDGLTTSP